MRRLREVTVESRARLGGAARLQPARTTKLAVIRAALAHIAWLQQVVTLPRAETGA